MGINPKREALAQAARILRRNRNSVIGLYGDHRDIIMDIENAYHEIIHNIELEIVELDKEIATASQVKP
jgi:hypothetical protein